MLFLFGEQGGKAWLYEALSLSVAVVVIVARVVRGKEVDFICFRRKLPFMTRFAAVASDADALIDY